jgi:hypothetical protein
VRQARSRSLRRLSSMRCARTWRTRCSRHCTALHCAALRCTALRCAALHCAALHCAALRAGAAAVRQRPHRAPAPCLCPRMHVHVCIRATQAAFLLDFFKKKGRMEASASDVVKLDALLLKLVQCAMRRMRARAPASIRSSHTVGGQGRAEELALFSLRACVRACVRA